MAENDIKVVKHPGGTIEYNAEDRTTSGLSATMKPGEPVKVGGTGNNFVTLLATGDPEAGTDEFVGIVRKESTETLTVDGKVEVVTLIPVKTTLRAKAETPTSINTAAKILALTLDWVTFDYDDTNFEIDENENSDPDVHGLQIIAGDPDGLTLDVIVSARVTSAAPAW